jgi:hypothetical protein
MLLSLQMIIVLKQHIWFPYVFCAEETNCYLKVCFSESREDKTLYPVVGWPTPTPPFTVPVSTWCAIVHVAEKERTEGVKVNEFIPTSASSCKVVYTLARGQQRQTIRRGKQWCQVHRGARSNEGHNRQSRFRRLGSMEEERWSVVDYGWKTSPWRRNQDRNMLAAHGKAPSLDLTVVYYRTALGGLGVLGALRTWIRCLCSSKALHTIGVWLKIIDKSL